MAEGTASNEDRHISVSITELESEEAGYSETNFSVSTEPHDPDLYTSLLFEVVVDENGEFTLQPVTEIDGQAAMFDEVFNQDEDAEEPEPTPTVTETETVTAEATATQTQTETRRHPPKPVRHRRKHPKSTRQLPRTPSDGSSLVWVGWLSPLRLPLLYCVCVDERSTSDGCRDRTRTAHNDMGRPCLQPDQ